MNVYTLPCKTLHVSICSNSSDANSKITTSWTYTATDRMFGVSITVLTHRLTRPHHWSITWSMTLRWIPDHVSIRCYLNSSTSITGFTQTHSWTILQFLYSTKLRPGLVGDDRCSDIKLKVKGRHLTSDMLLHNCQLVMTFKRTSLYSERTYTRCISGGSAQFYRSFVANQFRYLWTKNYQNRRRLAKSLQN